MKHLDRSDIERAADILRRGGLVAIPTETVYGLAANAADDRAVARIFEAKGRPRFNPLIVHVAGVDDARAYGEFSDPALQLAEAFWPGPLTLVLPRTEACVLSLLVSAGLDSVALRSPAHPLARAVIGAARLPLAAPSANRSGSVSPTTAAHVHDSLGARVDIILDGGPCAIGLESTILKIDSAGATLLRAGGLAVAEIERVIGEKIRRQTDGGSPVEAPGMLASHYAPDASLRIDIETPQSDEAYIAFGKASADHPYTLNLSDAGDLTEAAANLFAHLREADRLCRAHKLRGVAVAPIPREGLGEAINDRLRRASAPR